MKGPMGMAPKLIDIRQAAEMLGCPVSTLHYWRKGGEHYGPRAALVGRRLMYREDEVIAWIEEQFNKQAG